MHLYFYLKSNRWFKQMAFYSDCQYSYRNSWKLSRMCLYAVISRFHLTGTTRPKYILAWECSRAWTRVLNFCEKDFIAEKDGANLEIDCLTSIYIWTHESCVHILLAISCISRWSLFKDNVQYVPWKTATKKAQAQIMKIKSPLNFLIMQKHQDVVARQFCIMKKGRWGELEKGLADSRLWRHTLPQKSNISVNRRGAHADLAVVFFKCLSLVCR